MQSAPMGRASFSQGLNPSLGKPEDAIDLDLGPSLASQANCKGSTRQLVYDQSTTDG